MRNVATLPLLSAPPVCCPLDLSISQSFLDLQTVSCDRAKKREGEEEEETDKKRMETAVRTVGVASRDAGARSSEDSMAIYNEIQKGKERCPGCQQIIGLDCVQFRGQAWHTGCVKCSQCRGVVDFRQGYTERAGSVLCFGCSQASQAVAKGFCPECGKTLAGCSVVVYSGQKVSFSKIIKPSSDKTSKQFHDACVKCFSCHTPLVGKAFSEHQGHPYCPPCARGVQPGPSAVTTTIVTGRTGGFTVNPVTGKKRYL